MYWCHYCMCLFGWRLVRKCNCRFLSVGFSCRHLYALVISEANEDLFETMRFDVISIQSREARVVVQPRRSCGNAPFRVFARCATVVTPRCSTSTGPVPSAASRFASIAIVHRTRRQTRHRVNGWRAAPISSLTMSMLWWWLRSYRATVSISVTLRNTSL